MYDPMVAKLIVWDVDREQATARMLRALREYEIGGLKTLLPFHEALLQTRQWADAETCRDLIEDSEWLKSLGFPKPAEKEAEEAEPRGADLHGRGLRQALRCEGHRPAIRGRRREQWRRAGTRANRRLAGTPRAAPLRAGPGRRRRRWSATRSPRRFRAPC